MNEVKVSFRNHHGYPSMRLLNNGKRSLRPNKSSVFLSLKISKARGVQVSLIHPEDGKSKSNRLDWIVVGEGQCSNKI